MPEESKRYRYTAIIEYNHIDVEQFSDDDIKT